MKTEDVKVPNRAVGFIIGRAGENIRDLQARYGVSIQVQVRAVFPAAPFLFG